MNLYEAIFKRRSVRKFRNDRILEPVLEQIKLYCVRTAPLDKSIRVKFQLFYNLDGQVCLKGFAKVEAPYFLVLFSEEKNGCGKNAGYLTEQVVLYLAAKGLGSCYLGGSRLLTTPPEGMVQMIVVAFGYPKVTLYRDWATAKRLPLKELCVYKEEVDEAVKNLLKAARLAPSAFNFQPWRFLVYRNRICIFSCREYLSSSSLAAARELGMGIVMVHLMLAAEESWMDMEIRQEELLRRKVYKGGEYVATCFLSGEGIEEA